MDVLAKLAEHGPLGIVALAEAYALMRLYQDYKAALEKGATLAGQSLEAIKAMKDENKELSALVRSLSDALKNELSKRS